MNINLVEIDANKTVGKNPVLVDVAPSYVYENGKRTGEVSGFKYTVALPDKANGSVTENRDYLRKEGKWQGSDKEQTNLIDTFEEVGNVPKPVDQNSPDMSALIEEIENGLDTYEIIKLYPKYAFRIKEIDTLRQTVLELLCSC